MSRRDHPQPITLDNSSVAETGVWYTHIGCTPGDITIVVWPMSA